MAASDDGRAAQESKLLARIGEIPARLGPGGALDLLDLAAAVVGGENEQVGPFHEPAEDHRPIGGPAILADRGQLDVTRLRRSAVQMKGQGQARAPVGRVHGPILPERRRFEKTAEARDGPGPHDSPEPKFDARAGLTYFGERD